MQGKITNLPSTLRKCLISSTTNCVACPHACLKLLNVLSKWFRCFAHFCTQDCSIGNKRCVMANIEKCGPGTVDMERRISNNKSIVCAWNLRGHDPTELVRPSRSKNQTRRIPVSSMADIDLAVDENPFSSESDPKIQDIN